MKKLARLNPITTICAIPAAFYATIVILSLVASDVLFTQFEKASTVAASAASVFAFAALVYTLYLQQQQFEMQRKELDENRNELEKDRDERAKIVSAQEASAKQLLLTSYLAALDSLHGLSRQEQQSDELLTLRLRADRLQLRHRLEAILPTLSSELKALYPSQRITGFADSASLAELLIYLSSTILNIRELHSSVKDEAEVIACHIGFMIDKMESAEDDFFLAGELMGSIQSIEEQLREIHDGLLDPNPSVTDWKGLELVAMNAQEIARKILFARI